MYKKIASSLKEIYVCCNTTYFMAIYILLWYRTYVCKVNTPRRFDVLCEIYLD